MTLRGREIKRRRKKKIRMSEFCWTVGRACRLFLLLGSAKKKKKHFSRVLGASPRSFQLQANADPSHTSDLASLHSSLVRLKPNPYSSTQCPSSHSTRPLDQYGHQQGARSLRLRLSWQPHRRGRRGHRHRPAPCHCPLRRLDRFVQHGLSVSLRELTPPNRSA